MEMNYETGCIYSLPDLEYGVGVVVTDVVDQQEGHPFPLEGLRRGDILAGHWKYKKFFITEVEICIAWL